jgi:hypothetical protein
MVPGAASALAQLVEAAAGLALESPAASAVAMKSVVVRARIVLVVRNVDNIRAVQLGVAALDYPSGSRGT